ncbi:NAD(P)/FAD-dependent oxidoreductase [Desulfopila sp. IMCC35008]|uniref:phytoene desaturase family protein n=1 Tax=Desulfopila sp. IMCC35008 TaxID=2653858 RepID=UPI0013D430B2|nr:NAD(P)/FAD-dependent oxidoreductase [Desulfopila sp. IMCC35008]
MKVDVVVVGSGITGLTAGALLAGRGKRVAILEKQKYFGGAIRQFRRKQIAYDVGFHYTGCLGEGDILDLLWRACDVRDRISVERVPEHVYDRFEFNGYEGCVRGYFNYDQLEGELAARFPSERQGLQTYFQTIQAICSQVPFYNTELSLTPFLRGYKSRPQSLVRFLNQNIRDERLRGVLGAPAFLYGVPIAQCALEKHALVAHGYYDGAYTLAGGGQAVVDAFTESLGLLGTEMIYDCEATSIHLENGRVAGVDTADGERIHCEDVIFTGHPAKLLPLVPPSAFRPAYRSRLQGLKNSLSMFALFGRSEQALEDHGDGLNYYLLPGEGEVLPEEANTPHKQRPMMLTATSRPSGETLRSKSNGIILLRLGYWQDVEHFDSGHSGKRRKGYESFKQEVAAEMIETAEQRWGDLTGRIEQIAVGTPLTFRDELAAPGGCAYGAMHCLNQFNPEVRTRVPGLYLCGQSTLMTGVVGASISGLVGAGEILGLEPFWESLRTCN